MASANPAWKRALAALISSLKSQWLASVLLIPMAFLAINVHIANKQAQEARRQSINIESISQVQDSGKALDLALALYYQRISELGLSENNLQAPGSYEIVPVAKARSSIVDAREEAREAIIKHAGDVNSLRGTFDQAAVQTYLNSMADINSVIEKEADIDSTGRNVTALSNLVKARNAMVDTALAKVG